MYLLTALLIGLPAGLFATCFPGMLNMTAVATSLQAGRGAGRWFAVGLASTFLVQSVIGVVFADYLTRYPAVLDWLRAGAPYVFLGLAVFFGYKGLRARTQVQAESVEAIVATKGHYWRGAGLALLNLLTIPYFFTLGAYLIEEGYLSAVAYARLPFAVGAGVGALLSFQTYVRNAHYIERHAAGVAGNINFLLVGLFIVLTVLSL